MAIQDWELTTYQMAARSVVERMGENPDGPAYRMDGSVVPRWMEMAAKMHEIRLMMGAMQQYGPYGPL